MKMKCLLFVTLFMLVCVGCSEKTDNLNMERRVEKKLDEKAAEFKEHDENQAKFSAHAECVKSQKADILKDSVRFKAVFDSCWRECKIGL